MTRVYTDLRIEALCNADMADFMLLLAKINQCGRDGMSRSIRIHIDGDGSGHIGIKRLDDTKPIHEWIQLDEKKLKKVKDGDDFEDHYIGE